MNLNTNRQFPVLENVGALVRFRIGTEPRRSGLILQFLSERGPVVLAWIIKGMNAS